MCLSDNTFEQHYSMRHRDNDRGDDILRDNFHFRLRKYENKMTFQNDSLHEEQVILFSILSAESRRKDVVF